MLTSDVENLIDENNENENIIRCPQCYLIPFISINHSNEETYLKLKCLNNHEIKKPIKELYNEIKKNQLNLLKCEKCKEIDISKLLYCIKCYKILCKKENHEHILDEIPIEKIDSYCFEGDHIENKVTSFCHTHNKNICMYCKNDQHKNDIIEDLKYFDINIDDIRNNIKKSKENLNLLLNVIDSFFFELEKTIILIKDECEKYKENMETVIKITEDLLKIYEIQNKKHNLNFQIIQNIKNLSFHSIDFKIDSNIIFQMKNDFLQEFKKNLIELNNNDNNKTNKWEIR